MLDTVMIIQENAQPSTPGTPDASNDEYSEDTTRIYFGPFKSPEKRFAAVVAVPDPQLEHTHDISSRDIAEEPSQRSRPSSPITSAGSDEIVYVERLVGLNEDQLEDGSDGRPSVGTPPTSHFPDDDEPSSALASRLLRAIDNPSPPPSPVPLPAPGDVDETETEAGGQDEVGFSSEQEAVPVAPGFFSLGTAPQFIAPRSTSQVESEPDLMTFDDRLEPLIPLSTQPANPSQLPLSPFSFTETAATPAHAESPKTTRSFQGRVDILVDIQDDGPGANAPTRVNQQEGGGTDSGQVMAGRLEGPESGARPLSDHILNSGTQTIPLATASPHTPLRRSARPRKSATPHILNYLASSSSDVEASPAQSTPRSATTRKNRKGKERALSPSTHDGDPETRQASGNSFKANEESLNVKLQRRYSRSPIRREFGRELGSLSPNSVDLLISLVPSAPAAGSPANPEPSAEGPTSSVSTQVIPSEIHPGSPARQSTQAPDAELVIPVQTARFSSPVRLPVTPRRSQIPHSPSKLRLQPVSKDDPSRTPARRIPLEQAIAEGHVSPQKLSQMQTGTPAPVNIFTGQTMPVLNMSLKADSSPARRVFVAPPTNDETKGRPQSPRKPRLGEPKANGVNAGTDFQKIATTSQPAKLPFPLVAGPESHLNAEKGVPSKKPSVPNNIAILSLKQTTSRIPRKKPYSRPNAAPLIAERGVTKKASNVRPAGPLERSEASMSMKSLSRMPVGARNVTTTIAGKRVIRAVDLSKPAANKQTTLTSRGSSPRVTSATSEAIINSNDAPAVGNLKRKRLDSKSVPVASLRSTPLRQVTLDAPPPSVPVNRATAPSTMKTNQLASDAKTVAHTIQKPTVVKFRRVIPSVPSPSSVAEERCPTTPSLPEIEEEDCLEAETKQFLLPGEDMAVSSPTKETIEQSPLPSLPPATAPSPSPPPPPTPFVFVIDPLSPVSEHTPLPEGTINETTNIRRTTRLRKPTQTQPGTDMFDSDPSVPFNATRPSQRRRGNASQTPRPILDDVFSGMSMTTLKALTVNNTLRNQHYAVAKLETEIVRKEGARPESPAVKIKTITQRQQEEKVRQREERAARRARRQGSTANGEGEYTSDAGYESPTFANDSHDMHTEILAKHRRGAGDEGDYETPQKHTQGDVNGKGRVKWDRGLFTEVFLDEVILGTKAPPKGSMMVRGCLTTTAKTLRLDTMGNIIDPANPFLDLTQENVIVKKFVYDDDVEAVPQPATPAIRSTRSKSKKGKS